MTYIKRKILDFLSIGRLAVIKNYFGQQIEIGKSCKILHTVLNGHITIGECCKLYKVHLDGTIQIGRYTSLWGPNISMTSALNPIIIGNFCSIAKGVTFQEYNHDYRRFTTYFMESNLLKSNEGHKKEIVSKGSIVLEHDVWIGAQSVILGGAHISTGAVIAANSVVAGYIPPYAIVAGSPAKIIKYRFDEKVRNELLSSEWWIWSIDKLKAKIEELNSIVTQNNNQ